MSLRVRLVVGALCALALALSIADLLVYRDIRAHLVARLDCSLRQARLPFGLDEGGDGSGGGRRGRAIDAVVFAQLRRPDGTVERTAPAPLPDGTTASPHLPAVIRFMGRPPSRGQP